MAKKSVKASVKASKGGAKASVKAKAGGKSSKSGSASKSSSTKPAKKKAKKSSSKKSKTSAKSDDSADSAKPKRASAKAGKKKADSTKKSGAKKKKATTNTSAKSKSSTKGSAKSSGKGSKKASKKPSKKATKTAKGSKKSAKSSAKGAKKAGKKTGKKSSKKAVKKSGSKKAKTTSKGKKEASDDISSLIGSSVGASSGLFDSGSGSNSIFASASESEETLHRRFLRRSVDVAAEPKEPVRVVSFYAGPIVTAQVWIPLRPRVRGVHSIQHELNAGLRDTLQDVYNGTATLFLEATTAGIVLGENNAVVVMNALNDATANAIPEYSKQDIRAKKEEFQLADGNVGESAAIARAAWLGQSITIPILNGHLALGRTQGLWLCEQNGHGGSRKLLVTIMGSPMPADT